MLSTAKTRQSCSFVSTSFMILNQQTKKIFDASRIVILLVVASSKILSYSRFIEFSQKLNKSNECQIREKRINIQSLTWFACPSIASIASPSLPFQQQASLSKFPCNYKAYKQIYVNFNLPKKGVSKTFCSPFLE